jgi:hypothetical protein
VGIIILTEKKPMIKDKFKLVCSIAMRGSFYLKLFIYSVLRLLSSAKSACFFLTNLKYIGKSIINYNGKLACCRIPNVGHTAIHVRRIITNIKHVEFASFSFYANMDNGSKQVCFQLIKI